MGAEPSKPVDMQDTIREMKMAARKIEKDSGKCLTQQKIHEREALAAVGKNQTDIARIKAGMAMANKKRHLNMLKLGAQMQAVADKLEDADRMKTLSLNMRSITANLSSQLATMDLTQISTCLKEFGKEFEDLDVIGSQIDGALGTVVDEAAPSAEVDVYLMGLQKQAAMDAQGAAPGAASISAAGAAVGAGMQGAAPIPSGPAFPPSGGAPGAPPPGGAGGGGGGGGGESLQDRLNRLKNMGK